jgi:hypothetical protein
MDGELVRTFLSVYVGGVYTVLVYDMHVILRNVGDIGLSDSARGRCLTPSLFTDDATCSICLNAHAARGSAELVCGHCFHEACIDAWLRVATTCPNCRFELAEA